VLISPPFLPHRPEGMLDIDYIALAMKGDAPGNGAYPVSLDLGWHGGLHLKAPSGTNGAEPVRAIADGTVAYVRKDKPIVRGEAAAKEPLAYNGWTSDGVVVLRHETEIGENLTVTYYSIYQHLIDIDTKQIQQGQRIYRKDVLGNAGYIDGQPDYIHFEIICDDTNLAQLIGRSSGSQNTGSHGRSDALWGEIYCQLPAGTPIYPTDLVAALKAVNRAGTAKALAAAQKQYNSAQDPQGNGGQSTRQPYIIGLNYGRGDCHVTTYSPSGEVLGRRTESEYEYDLYDEAVALYPKCPSAGYELLRFGRVLGPDSLAPADAPYWRQIDTPDGKGWVNLAAPGISFFSDADFPDWCGWQLVNDSADGDSRCDSPTIRDLFEKDDYGRIPPKQAQQQMAEPIIRAKLQKMIVKCPTEWEKATFDTRWNWLKGDPDDLADVLVEPMNDEDFAKLKAHAEALCFWEEAKLPIDAKHWHFSGREFIAQFRKCCWLSQDEMKQLVPVTIVRGKGAGLKGPFYCENISSRAGRLIATHHINLNKAWRKYLVNTPQRLAAFVANSTEETSWWADLEEGGKGVGYSYAPWYGRGFLQLTWQGNYEEYWRFTTPLSRPSGAAQVKAARDGVSGDPFAAADSAGAYWAWNQTNFYADKPINNFAITIIVDKGSPRFSGKSLVVYADNGFRDVACKINLPRTVGKQNPPLNGLVDRYTSYANAQLILLDTPEFPDSINNKPSWLTLRRK